MADATDTKAIEAAEKAFAEAAATAPAAKADAKPAPKKTAAKQPAAKKAAPKKAAPKKAPAKKATKKTVSMKKVATKKPVKKTARVAKKSNVKETTMAKAKKTETKATNMMADLQERAKAAFGKGGEFAGDFVEFNKANVEAMVESGKIVAEGVQDMGKDYVEEAKSAYEVFTADMKEFAGVRSPTDLFELQGKLARRNFDAAVEFGSKNTEKMVKIANDAVAPISNRVSVATEKLTKAA